MRMALGIEYDGRGFCGWQSQAGGCGVQDAVQRAVAEIAGATTPVVAAGRTDAGVHAIGQVVHFDTGAARPPTAWVRGVNSHLPDAARVLWARSVADGFHARFSALQRSYCYLLYNHPLRPALLHGRVGWYHQPLACDAMAQASALLLGRHDFTSFRAAECQSRTPVRTLSKAQVRRAGDYLVMNFAADAFLHHMVRNIVGALVYVGAAKYPPQWMRELLAARDRSIAPPTFAPDGLYLSGVRYEESFGLAQSEREPVFELLMA